MIIGYIIYYDYKLHHWYGLNDHHCISIITQFKT
jgi:hypothetical protein